MSLLLAFNNCGKVDTSIKNAFGFKLFGKAMFISYEILDCSFLYTISGRDGTVLETGEYTRVN